MRSESKIYRPTHFGLPMQAVYNGLSFLSTVLLAVILHLAPAYGQSMRTYVSGNGIDSNPCTFAKPCRTLQVALNLTSPGGEIQSLNSADYGYLTINQAVTLLGVHGATGVLAANVSGITINAGANDVVTLKGLEIDGTGSGANGILFNSGAALSIQDSEIRGFATGINFQAKAASSFSVSGTVLSNNTTGILFQASTASAGVLNDSQLVNNASGAIVQGASSSSAVSLTVHNGVVANNATVGILSNGFSTVSVSDATVANNGIGVQAQNAGAVLQMSGSSLTGNTTGWAALNGGQVISSAKNAIGGNLNGNSAPPTSATPPPPPAVSHLTDGAGNYFADSNAGYVSAL